MASKTFVIFGASTTYGAWDYEGGWVQRLRKSLDKETIKERGDYLVYNCGISGNTTEDLLKRFDIECKARTKEMIEYKGENIIMISIGGNDSVFLKSKNDFWVAPEKFKGNVKKLIKLAEKYSNKIIFVGCVPIDDSKTNPVPWNPNIIYKQENIKKYNDMVKEICKEANLMFIDVFNEWLRLDYKKWLYDGLHPNSRGHEKIFEIVKGFLIKNKII